MISPVINQSTETPDKGPLHSLDQGDFVQYCAIMNLRKGSLDVIPIQRERQNEADSGLPVKITGKGEANKRTSEHF